MTQINIHKIYILHYLRKFKKSQAGPRFAEVSTPKNLRGTLRERVNYSYCFTDNKKITLACLQEHRVVKLSLRRIILSASLIVNSESGHILGLLPKTKYRLLSNRKVCKYCNGRNKQ